MLLNYKNGIKGGITGGMCHYVETKTKLNTCVIMIKKKESTYIQYLHFTSHYGWDL